MDGEPRASLLDVMMEDLQMKLKTGGITSRAVLLLPTPSTQSRESFLAQLRRSLDPRIAGQPTPTSALVLSYPSTPLGPANTNNDSSSGDPPNVVTPHLVLLEGPSDAIHSAVKSAARAVLGDGSAGAGSRGGAPPARKGLGGDGGGALSGVVLVLMEDVDGVWGGLGGGWATGVVNHPDLDVAEGSLFSRVSGDVSFKAVSLALRALAGREGGAGSRAMGSKGRLGERGSGGGPGHDDENDDLDEHSYAPVEDVTLEDLRSRFGDTLPSNEEIAFLCEDAGGEAMTVPAFFEAFEGPIDVDIEGDTVWPMPPRLPA